MFSTNSVLDFIANAEANSSYKAEMTSH